MNFRPLRKALLLSCLLKNRVADFSQKRHLLYGFIGPDGSFHSPLDYEKERFVDLHVLLFYSGSTVAHRLHVVKQNV